MGVDQKAARDHLHPGTEKCYLHSKTEKSGHGQMEEKPQDSRDVHVTTARRTHSHLVFSATRSWQTSGYFIWEVIFICPLEHPAHEWIFLKYFFFVLIILVTPTHCKTFGNFRNRNKEMQSHVHSYPDSHMYVDLCVCDLFLAGILKYSLNWKKSVQINKKI